MKSACLKLIFAARKCTLRERSYREVKKKLGGEQSTSQKYPAWIPKEGLYNIKLIIITEGGNVTRIPHFNTEPLYIYFLIWTKLNSSKFSTSTLCHGEKCQGRI